MSSCSTTDLVHERDRLRASYLDLMCDSLVGMLNQDAPLAACDLPAYAADYRTRGWDWPSNAPSMIGRLRMANVRSECERLLAEKVPGDFIETGVWRGGACIMMRAVLHAYAVTDRRVIAADTFAGLPPPSSDIPPDKESYLHTIPEFAVSLNEVKSAFSRYGLLDGQVVFVEGLLKETLPTLPVDMLAMLRLDADMYESTMDGLTHLYPKVSRRGSIIVDDYFLFEAHRRAVDEYRASHEIHDEIVQIDDFGGYWIKS